MKGASNGVPEAGVSTSRANTHKLIIHKRLQSLLFKSQATPKPETGLLLSCSNSSFQLKIVSISFGSARVWRKRRGTFFDVQCDVSAGSDNLGFHIICLCFHFGPQIYSRIFFTPKATEWQWGYSPWLTSKLDWPEPYRESEGA